MGNLDKFSKKIADDIALTKFSVYKTHADNKMIAAVPALKSGESSALFERVTPKGKEQLLSISSDFRSFYKELFSSVNNSFKTVMAKAVEASKENILKARRAFGKYLEKTLNDAAQEIFEDVIQDKIIDKYEKRYRTSKHGKSIDLMLKSLKDTLTVMMMNIKKYLKIKINLKEDSVNSFKENKVQYEANDLYSIDVEFNLFDLELEKNIEKSNNTLNIYERRKGTATFPGRSYYDKSKGKVRYRKASTTYNISALEEVRKNWVGHKAGYSLLTIIDLGSKSGYEIKPKGKPIVKQGEVFDPKGFKKNTYSVTLSHKKYLLNAVSGSSYLFQRRVIRRRNKKGEKIIFEGTNLVNKKIEIEFTKRLGEFMRDNYGQIKDDMLEWLTKTTEFKKVEIKRRATKAQRISMLKNIATRQKGA